MADDVGRVQEIICRLGKLPAINPDEDFYAAGFSSVTALELLMELESAFEVTIPDDAFIAARTATDLANLVVRLKQG